MPESLKIVTNWIEYLIVGGLALLGFHYKRNIARVDKALDSIPKTYQTKEDARKAACNPELFVKKDDYREDRHEIREEMRLFRTDLKDGLNRIHERIDKELSK